MDASNVKITLDGKDVELVCTVEAVLIMSRAYGGMMKLYEKVKDLDLEAITVVVRAGTMVDGKEAEDLMAKVYKTGLVNLMADVGDFVLLASSPVAGSSRSHCWFRPT